MGFLSLLKVASMPTFQVLIISLLGACMATDYLNLLPADARRYMNKIVFVAFTPSLVFASLARTVDLKDIISSWFMPVNVGITFLVGGTLGWIVVKLLRLEPHLQGLIIAMCSSGNLGNIMLIIIPAICKESGSPFGDKNICTNIGLSYVSFSMAIGAFYIWTYTFHLIQSASTMCREVTAALEGSMKVPNKDLEVNEKSHLLHGADHVSTPCSEDSLEKQSKIELHRNNAALWDQIKGVLRQLGQELLAPPVVAGIAGLVFGAVSWLHGLIIGEDAPLRVIDDSIKLLGDGTIPCITLILGGNLTQGLRNARLKMATIMAVIVVKFIILPAVGIGVVKAASQLGFLSSDPLYHFVLMVQFTVPPTMNIGTMTQLFDVAQDECSVLFLWTYLIAALAFTVWSTIFMWILS